MNEYIRTYEFEDHLGLTPVRVCQSPDPSLGHGATVWDAALVLCAFLESDIGRSLIAGTKCVELGSGTGIVALAAEAVGASQSIATDKDNCVPFIKQNVGLNSHSATKVMSLDWTATALTTEFSFVDACDWILCADCVYDNDCIDDLIRTISVLNPRRGVIVSNEGRTGPKNIQAEKQFIKGMYDQVGLKGKAVDREVLRPDWRCDDIHVVVFERPEIVSRE